MSSASHDALATGPRTSGRRDVGGWLLDAVVASSQHARIELLRRACTGRINWRFQQSSPTVFWFRSGVRGLRLDVDGQRFDSPVTVTHGLCFFPPEAKIQGEFTVDPIVDYTAAFLDPLLAKRYGLRIPGRPLIGLTHGPMERGLHDLSQYARQPDGASEPLVEGWALQSLAHLSRLEKDPFRGSATATPGLPSQSLALVDQYVREHLAESLSVDQLAESAGFSRRHFLRAFKQRTGQTPMRYVYSLRLDEAKLRLTNSDEPVTAIATACGFSHAQHLSTALRQATGMTPSQFRGQR
jgi:AraC family transcriptional regulator